VGNTNGFVSGITYLRDAKEGNRPAYDSKRVARRFARGLIEDLGGEDVLTAQKLEIIDHLRRDKETLNDLYACRDEILESKPQVRRNIGALAKLDAFIAPVQTRIVSNLIRLGLERVAKTIELAPWEREQATEAKVSK
jgi:hypothetical protein